MVIAKVRRLFRRRLRRPHRMARRLRRDIRYVIALNKEVSGLKDGILKLARLASLDKKQIKELRAEVNDLLSRARLEIDYFIKVFVDAETMIFDANLNLLGQVQGAVERLEKQGFPKEHIAKFKQQAKDLGAKLFSILDDIKMLVRKAERGTIGGVSVASTLQLEHKIRRLSKFIYYVRFQIMDLFADLAEKEEALDMTGVQNDISLLLDRIGAEINAIHIVARDNRILAKRFKEMIQNLAKGLRSTNAPDNIKAVVANTAERIEDYEEKALKQARKMAYREYRILA